MSNWFTQAETVILGARDWMLVALILALSVIALSIWSYAIRGPRSGMRLLALLLKTLAVCALAFCLLEPMRRSERPRPGANLMALVADNSRSMEMRAPGQSQSRVDGLRAKLNPRTAWQTRLAQDFEIRRYAFDDRLHPIDDLTELDFQGNSSSLADALETLRTRFATRPVAGVMLFTDGLATDSTSKLLANGGFSFPIYPVVDETDRKLQDISIADTSVATSSFELAPITIEALVNAQGMAGRDIAVRLFDAAGTTLQEQQLACDSDPFEKRVRFQFQPSTAGLQFISVRAMLSSEDSGELQASSRVEVTTANNTRLMAVDRGGGPFRILYVAGRPNWEFKFLRRALEEDVELSLVGLIRIAPKEPKFSFRDKGVDTTNPLLAGFDEDQETAEQYDEPVLKAFGVEPGEELASFPSTEESLYKYQAVILDDIEAAFFTQQQMLLIREFVSARGGGLMMLGGQESFLGGGYRDTPLGDVLPVYLRGREDSADKEQVARYRLSREGSLEPWLRLRPNQGDEQMRVAEMPDFLDWNVVADAKPGAAVLAEITTGDETRPGLVTQRFGKGRALALTVGDFWRWSMRRQKQETDDLAQSWRQIARWLTNDVPQRMQVVVLPPEGALQPYRIQISLRDAAYKPLDNASVKLKITEPGGQTVATTATPDSAQRGLYSAEFWSQDDGGYSCEIEAIAADGEILETRKAGWAAQPSAVEFAKIEGGTDFLTQLAELSGGEVVPLQELDAFVESLPDRKVPVTEVRIEPLWHRPWLVLFAIGCLCLEWGIRRWKGLP